MPKRSKRYTTALDYDRDLAYPPADAVTMAQQRATAAFDETMELHLRTSLDPRHADQQIRSTTQLPHGLGRQVRVAVFAEGDAARAATAAGATIVGADDLIARVADGFTDFDTALAQRDLMGKVGKLGRILGPRGLMPNPRSGTVVDGADIAKAVADAQHGRVEFRLDRQALIHVSVGKASFTSQQLLENIAAVVQEILKAKPSGAKGAYIRGIHLSPTMGPSVRMELQETLALQSE